jgi:DNA-binding helix-hairpin-helix protein with protein kinase domain
MLIGADGQMVGYVMPSVVGHEELGKAFLAVHRQDAPEYYREADWAWLVRVARNLAAAIHTVHRAGHVIGDVNPRNAMVSRQATVRLIDCDSFQIRDQGRLFPCPVGMPHYIPPELRGQDLATTERTPNHDAFGLAVLCFQLLFGGRHPFSGRYLGAGDLPIERAIAEYLFPFSRSAASSHFLPPPLSLTLGHVPNPIADLFERAFTARRGPRPTPLEWVRALDDLGAQITRCRAAPWHQFAAMLKSCPWCEILQCGGPELFFTVQLAAGPVKPVDVAELWQSIAAVMLPPRCSLQLRQREAGRDQSGLASLPPPLPVSFVVPLATVEQPSSGDLEAALLAEALGLTACICSLVVAVVSVVLQAELWTIVSVGVAAMAGVAAGVGYGSCRPERQKRRADEARAQAAVEAQLSQVWAALRACHADQVRAHQKCLAAMKRLTAASHRRAAWLATEEKAVVQQYEQQRQELEVRFTELRQRLEDCWRKCQELDERERNECALLTADGERVARDRFLNRHFIADATIAGIGKELKTRLSNLGIVTAADLTESDLRRLAGNPGFGEKRLDALRGWRRQVSSGFRFDPSQALSPVALAPITTKYMAMRQGYESRLATGRASLDELIREVTAVDRGAKARLAGPESQLPPGIRAECQAAERNLRAARAALAAADEHRHIVDGEVEAAVASAGQLRLALAMARSRRRAVDPLYRKSAKP